MLPDLAWDWIYKIEGEHSSDPGGGDTWYGIARKYHPGIPWPPTPQQARVIYDQEYWSPARCDFYQSVGLALAMFDSAVNPGLGAIAPLLQGELHVTPDGILGAKTIQAVQALSEPKKKFLLGRLLAARNEWYRHSPYVEANFLGWSRRLFMLQQVCLEHM